MIELIPVILVLIFLEVLLSIDNALFNAAIASEFEDEEKKKMLRMAMLIEISFRLITLFLMSLIIQNAWLKFLCGVYLMIIALKHLLVMLIRRDTSLDFLSHASWRYFR